MSSSPKHSKPIKGRGAVSNPQGRFDSTGVAAEEDGWWKEEEIPPLLTTVTVEHARTIISRNQSPDIPFDQSINPYRGCEHGCVYCFARPSHAYMDLSPGLDFETKLFYKPDAAMLLEQELRQPGYHCSPINLGANTDPYQPLERKLEITRSILKVLQRYRHPVTIVTKGVALIGRDIDILAEMASAQLATVAVSVTTLDDDLKRILEPRAASPASRLRVIQKLSEAGIPVTTLVAPVIPHLTDWEIERVLEAAAGAGATMAGYVMLRLPHEVEGLFREWVNTHYPMKAKHIFSLVQQMHQGRSYDSRWGVRQRGEGEYAALIQNRFRLACKRLGINQRGRWALDTTAFAVPAASGDQLSLI